MAIARAQLVDTSLTRWYHCVTRCVRKAFLLGEGDHNRKEWLENRLEELAEIFAVAVGGFSVMDNHLHVLLRLDPDVARAWSDDEVVRRGDGSFRLGTSRAADAGYRALDSMAAHGRPVGRDRASGCKA